MRKYILDDEQQFQVALKRLVKFYELQEKTLEDPALDADTRAYSLENMNGLIESHREAIRDHLVSLAVQSSQEQGAKEQSRAAVPEPQLARAA